MLSHVDLNYFRREKREQAQLQRFFKWFVTCSTICKLPCWNGDLSNKLPSKRRKVNERHVTDVYSPRKRASIEHYATLHGPTRASVYYGKQLAHNVPESTCRKFHDEYRKELKKKSKECSTWRDDTAYDSYSFNCKISNTMLILVTVPHVRV